MRGLTAGLRSAALRIAERPPYPRALELSPHAGRGAKNLVLATHNAPELCHAIPEGRHCEKPTGPARSGRPDDKLRDEEKRKQNADRRVIQPSASCDAAHALTLSHPAYAGGRRAGALACRRSTTALAAATERYSSAPDTRFLGLGRGARSQRFEQPGSKDRARLNGRYPLLPAPVQRASRRPVIVPAGRLFPEPPGSGGDEPPPAGTALAPDNRGHRLPSCSRARFDDRCSRNGDGCQGTVAEIVTGHTLPRAPRCAECGHLTPISGFLFRSHCLQSI